MIPTRNRDILTEDSLFFDLEEQIFSLKRSTEKETQRINNSTLLAHSLNSDNFQDIWKIKIQLEVISKKLNKTKKLVTINNRILKSITRTNEYKINELSILFSKLSLKTKKVKSRVQIRRVKVESVSGSKDNEKRTSHAVSGDK